jgi:putative FmdB family regulatory protein
MPIYRYQCEACEQVFETLVMKQNETVACPSCHSEKLQKLLTSHAVGSNAPDTPCGSGACSPMPPCAGGMCGMG